VDRSTKVVYGGMQDYLLKGYKDPVITIRVTCVPLEISGYKGEGPF
jgi:hypothetical protein